ncbi:MAG: hypothetical protein KBD52_00115 [Candidatus Pacebacteria bacterium]|nr:hypothetical protein [Candidatus Paceibacterota bacterium]
MIFNKTKLKNKRGFVMLFAVVLSGIIFSISLGMINISLKEINFGTSAKATNEAFFAADTGAECALFYDLVPVQSFFGLEDALATINGINPMCGGSILNIEEEFTGVGPWNFVVLSLGENKKSCAKVKLTRTIDISTGDLINTQIISKGYNMGGDSTDCSSTNNNRVERVLELNY